MINGQKIALLPATLADQRRVYEWCFLSETTKSHFGPPDYPDIAIPSYEEFCASYYEDYFFTGAKPAAGQVFIITHQGEPVGAISYCSFHLKPGLAELDIWLNAEKNCGQGFGTDALLTLADFIHQKLGINEMIIAPSRKNTRAVKSYQKAGFAKSAQAMSEFVADEYLSLYGQGDYGPDETVILVKRF